MSRPPLPRSTAEHLPFSQLEPGSEDPEVGLEESMHQSTGDLLNGDQFQGEEAYTGATASRYFTNLLVNGVEQAQDLSPTSDPPIRQSSAAAKSSQGRSKNFRDEEDILLVSGWLNVSLDPIHGADQRQGTFWKRIHAYFHANKTFESNRSESSLMNRWSGIQHDVNLFCGYISKLETRNQSGSNPDDKIAKACEWYKKDDPKDRKFAYLHCWRILKDQPKWMDRRKEIGCAKKTSNKKQKTMDNSATASDGIAPVGDGGAPVGNGVAPIGDGGNPGGRPGGRNGEKLKLRQRSTIEAVDYLMVKKKEADIERDLKKEERCNKAFALQQERINLEKEKFQFQRDLEEERILCLDLSTMDYKLQQYYEVRQNEILRRRCNI